MSALHPFRALRPRRELVDRVVCPPYDVISVAEARALHAGQHESFLRVIRPEVDLPGDVDEHDDVVYARGAANLRELAAEGILQAETAPALYVYRLTWRGRDQVGVFACVSVDAYDRGEIVRHEMTRVDKEDDRTRHILELGAHAEPVMLTYRDSAEVAGLMEAAQQAEPLYDLEAYHGVRHTLWRVEDPAPLLHAFGDVDRLYIADGHHRARAASRVAGALPEHAEARWFPAVLFPMSHMRILPYHRVVVHAPGGGAAFLASLAARSELRAVADGEPRAAGEVRVVSRSAGQVSWHAFTLPQTAACARAASLDVARLDEFVLGPLLGIADPRTDANLRFVGGIRGPGELERLVASGEADLGLAMHPTAIGDLVEVSDAAELMPPKSTWFEPKLLSGLLVHRFT